MNLLARILSHGFAFAVVAIIIVVLMYRGDLFEEGELTEILGIKSQPQATEEAGSGTVDRAGEELAVSAETAEPSHEVAEDEPVSTPAATDSADMPVEVEESSSATDITAGTDMEAEVEQTTSAEPVENIDGTSVAGVDDEDTVEDEPAELPVDEAASPQVPDDAAVPATESATPAETEAVEESTADAVPVTEQASQPVADVTTTESPYTVMARAREAYWLRDFETAEQHYRQLIQIDPDNPDGYGEMGNMYFSQGKWDEAAAAYYEAGTRLLNEGLVVQARQMLEVIRGLNGSQADALEAQIESASTPSP